MKIRRVQATYLSNLPTPPPPFRKEPSRGSAGILEIETDDGLIGYGMIAPEADGFIKHRAEDFLNGKDPLLTDQVWQQMFKQFARRGNGPHGSALAAIDVALWDIKGKALGLPVWRLLGGAQQRVNAYISFGVGGPGTNVGGEPYSTEELIAEANHLTAQGHTKLKTAAGRFIPPDPDEDVARMAALRDALGPDVKLMMDGACQMEFQDAVRLCKLCEPLNITFFEEPVRFNDIRTLAELRRHTILPVATNPRGYRWEYRDLFVNDAADFPQPNVAQIGITEAWKIAEMAKAFNRQIANGNGYGPHNLHLQAGVSNGWGVEFHLRQWMIYKAVFQNVPVPKSGWVSPLETPGFGLDPKPDVMKEYKVAVDR